MHPKTNHKGLVSIREHPWVLGQATGIWTHLTHHGPDSREATTFPLIVFSVALRPHSPRSASARVAMSSLFPESASESPPPP
jgi:hypothetical protein